jgi:hypothetical protein
MSGCTDYTPYNPSTQDIVPATRTQVYRYLTDAASRETQLLLLCWYYYRVHYSAKSHIPNTTALAVFSEFCVIRWIELQYSTITTMKRRCRTRAPVTMPVTVH